KFRYPEACSGKIFPALPGCRPSRQCLLPETGPFWFSVRASQAFSVYFGVSEFLPAPARGFGLFHRYSVWVYFPWNLQKTASGLGGKRSVNLLINENHFFPDFLKLKR